MGCMNSAVEREMKGANQPRASEVEHRGQRSEVSPPLDERDRNGENHPIDAQKVPDAVHINVDPAAQQLRGELH
jgi:hypothetical protein